MDALEEFENRYYYFRQHLEILAQEPLEQCTRQGNYNTAWELQNDVLRDGSYLVHAVSDSMTSLQREKLGNLLEQLELVPVNDLPAGAGPDANVVAMKHPAWAPVRTAARELLLLLRPLTVSNERYFAEAASKPFALSATEVASYLEHFLRDSVPRADWERFVGTPLPGAPNMDVVRKHCVRIAQFGGVGSGEFISLTHGARAQIEQLLRDVRAEL